MVTRASAFAGSAEQEAPFRTAHGVAPSPWIMALPWAIRAPIIALYVDTLRPDDDFLTQLRKLVISVGVIFAFAVLLTMVLNNLTIESSTSAPAILARFALGPAFAVVFGGAYAMLRLTSWSLEVITGVFVYVIWFAITLIIISLPDFASDDALVVVAVLAQLLRAPKLGVLFGLTALAFVVAAVNNASYARGEPEYPLWALDGAIMRGAVTRLLQKLVSLFDYALCFAALQIQLLESDRLTEQALASSAIALDVAERLGQYDTEGASESIAEVAAKQVASPDLIASLTVLADNLNKYRPHLPNWLLPRAVTSSDEDVIDASRRPDDARTERSLSSRRAKSVGSDGEMHAGTSDTSARSANGDAKESRGGGGRDSAVSWFRNGASFTSEVTLAFIHFAALPTSDATASAGRRSVASDSGLFRSINSTGDALSDFTDVVHRFAGQAHAAVHSFVGDTVVVSWNAASRAVQREAKAARMVARLRARLTASGIAVNIRGFIVSGSATIKLAGGAQRQQAITISAPSWLAARQDAMASMLTRAASGVVLLDAASKLASEFAVVTRPFAVTVESRAASGGPLNESGSRETTAPAPTTRTAAYELLGECDEGNEEWMYVMQQNEAAAGAATSDTVGRLFDLWRRGDDEAVNNELHAIADTRSPKSAPGFSDIETRLNQLALALRKELSS